MRRAQVAEFIGMMVIILLFVSYALFTKMGSVQSRAQVLERERLQAAITSSATGAIALPYRTVQGIPVNELLAYAACYKKTHADYGNNIIIDIDLELKDMMDEIYGEDNWLIELAADEEQNLCLDSALAAGACGPPQGTVLAYELFLPLPCIKQASRNILYVGPGIKASIEKNTKYLKLKSCKNDFPPGSHCNDVKGTLCGQSEIMGAFVPTAKNLYYIKPVPTRDCDFGCCVRKK